MIKTDIWDVEETTVTGEQFKSVPQIRLRRHDGFYLDPASAEEMALGILDVRGLPASELNRIRTTLKKLKGGSVKKVKSGAKSSQPSVQWDTPKKKRGRPPGSKNKVKSEKRAPKRKYVRRAGV